MIRITKEEWNNYITTLRAINDEAAQKIINFINYMGIENISGDQTKLLIDYCYNIVRQYGEAAGALSAEMYDAVAALEGRYLAPAEIAELASYGDVAKAVNGTLNVSQNVEEIASAAARWVKMASADTTLHNAIRDGAQFAWIPYGKTCAFCLVLASRGWQYASKAALKGGHAEHIHSNCDCQSAIRYDNKSTVDGYDPDEYLSMYRHADGRTPQERINAMRREAYAEDKKTEGTDNQGLIDVN